MFCPTCRMANPDAAQYCSKCGNSLPASPAVAASGSQNPAVAAPGPMPVPEVPTSGKAMASLVCGIFTFFLPASIAAIILGHLSLSDIRKSAGRLGGRGAAIVGLLLGYAGIAVIPLILIIAAIAIPNLLRAKMVANEAAAVGSLRAINIAAVQYASTYENGFPSNFEAFGSEEGSPRNCNHAGLLDRRLGAGQKNGYIFTYSPRFPNGQPEPVVSPKAAVRGCTSGGASGFSVTADPIRSGSTGGRNFYTDQTGVIRYSNDGEPATAESPPLE
jgi:type IV pilus assembly protein PilA